MLWFDTETYNEVPISHGTYAYTSTCEPMIVTYAFDDGEVQCWDLTVNPEMPEDLALMLRDPGGLLCAHNAMFDRNVLKYGLGIDTPIERWRCTMVRALAHGLPGGLDALCTVMGVELSEAKLKTGKQLVHLFCKPQKFKHSIPKTVPLKERKVLIAAAEAAWTGRATRGTHPAEWQAFLEYAAGDIRAMRALDKIIPTWNYAGEELELYHLDQKINDRGFLVDVELANAAVRAVDSAKAALADKTVEITNGTVESTTKRDQLLAHILREHGVELPDLQMATLERRINDFDLPPALRELLIIRLQASSTSTSKYTALLKAVSADNRLRGTLQFNGASRTRRWAGRTFQPQNLPSKGAPKHEVIDGYIDAMKGDYADIVIPNVMQAASYAVRGCIIAPPGKKLVIADLSNIEGRDQAWLAGEEWKLQAFRDYDAGTGPDLYKLAYSKAFKIPVGEVTKYQRQIGKIKELMLGYGGGAGAFVTGAASYNIDLEALAAVTYDTLPAEIAYEAEGFLKWTRKDKRPTFGLSDKAFMTCDGLKRLWRLAHLRIASLWKELESGAIRAIETPDTTVEVGKFKIRKDGAWLRIRLPSDRYLCYPSPKVAGGKILYMGNSQYTRQWTRLGTYGGKLFENCCQALAGDVMKANMPRIEAAGYQIILTVHDEVVCEAPDSSEFSAERLSKLLSTTPPWAEGMPLAAAGFETYRYRKE